MNSDSDNASLESHTPSPALQQEVPIVKLSKNGSIATQTSVLLVYLIYKSFAYTYDRFFVKAWPHRRPHPSTVTSLHTDAISMRLQKLKNIPRHTSERTTLPCQATQAAWKIHRQGNPGTHRQTLERLGHMPRKTCPAKAQVHNQTQRPSFHDGHALSYMHTKLAHPVGTMLYPAPHQGTHACIQTHHDRVQ